MRQSLAGTLPEFNRQDHGIIDRQFRFEVITPMIGGDSESWKLNLAAPVRGPSVKGQLRFWWRAMQAETVCWKLLDSENQLWGGKIKEKGGKNTIRRQSKVKIAIIDQVVIKTGRPVADGTLPGYVAFPLKDPDSVSINEMAFTLRISYPVEAEDIVLDTLKLWTLFGGVGARTRRGCGSLYCEALLDGLSDESDILAFLRRFRGTAEELPYCRLGNARLAVSKAGGNARKAWGGLMDCYRNFRQDRPAGKRPGRSYWPEPDAIRIVTEQQAPLHAPEHPDGMWFPRAAYGLPIITKFNTGGNGKGDPEPQVSLQPDIGTGDRWPSPVVLKAIRLGNGAVFCIALLLTQSFPGQLVLKQRQANQEERPWPLPAEANPLGPGGAVGKQMKTLRGKELQAGETVYEALFRELGLKEVV